MSKAILQFFLVSLLLGACAFSLAPASIAQEDPNAQYIALVSGELAGQPREIEVPIEVGALRVFFNLQTAPGTTWMILTPTGLPLALNEPNISVSESKTKNTISMWDPRPGLWKVRLHGNGAFNLSVSVQGELYVCCPQFFGRNLIYTPDKFQPVRGLRQPAQVYVSGYNIDTIQFQLLDEQGQPVAPIKFRQSDFSNPYNFSLLLETPDHPFRICARGRDTSGKQFQRVLPWLIRPVSSETANAQPETSPGNQTLGQWSQEAEKSAVTSEYKLVRAQIVKWADEPLLSDKASAIGLRLKFSIKFPADGVYQPIPQAYPERIGYGYTGALGLRIHRATVEPTPEGVINPQQVLLAGRPVFKGGIAYDFVVDMVPNYAQYNEQKKTFCLQTRGYSQQNMQDRFEREVMSELKLRFRFSVSGTDLDGRVPSLTENSYVPKLWYQNYLKDGATECQ